MGHTILKIRHNHVLRSCSLTGSLAFHMGKPHNLCQERINYFDYAAVFMCSQFLNINYAKCVQYSAHKLSFFCNTWHWGKKEPCAFWANVQCTIFPESGKDFCGMSDLYFLMDVGHILKQQNSHSNLCKQHMFVHITPDVNSTCSCTWQWLLSFKCTCTC